MMKIPKFTLLSTVIIVFSSSLCAFGEAPSDEQNLTHGQMIARIMDLSGLNAQIPQIADTIANRSDIKAFLSTLSDKNREVLDKEISAAFDGNAMLEIVQDELSRTLSAQEAKALLAWFASKEGRAMTVLEEIPKEREEWREIYSMKKDPKPDARRLEIYRLLLYAINFAEHAVNEQTMLQRFLRGLILQDVPGYKIEKDLKRERKKMAKEVWETAMLSLSYDLASVDEAVLLKYAVFLDSPAARAYQEGKSIGLIRAISLAGDKVLSKAEDLIVRYPYASLSDLHPKSSKLKRYKEACEEGDMQGCFDLGYAYRHGKGIKRNYFKALTPLKMSCSGGIPKGCAVLGDMYWLGLGVKVNYTKMTQYYLKGCNGGYPSVCNGVAISYSTGYGIPKDEKKAIVYFNKACDAGNELACRSLARRYEGYQGVEQDYAKAREFFEKACKLGDIASCWMEGRYYYNGLGVTKDHNKAMELYKMSCDKRNMHACYDLGNIYAEGKVVKQDFAKARKFFHQGCKLGSQDACSAYRALERQKENKAK